MHKRVNELSFSAHIHTPQCQPVYAGAALADAMKLAMSGPIEGDRLAAVIDRLQQTAQALRRTGIRELMEVSMSIQSKVQDLNDQLGEDHARHWEFVFKTLHETVWTFEALGEFQAAAVAAGTLMDASVVHGTKYSTLLAEYYIYIMMLSHAYMNEVPDPELTHAWGRYEDFAGYLHKQLKEGSVKSDEAAHRMADITMTTLAHACVIGQTPQWLGYWMDELKTVDPALSKGIFKQWILALNVAFQLLVDSDINAEDALSLFIQNIDEMDDRATIVASHSFALLVYASCLNGEKMYVKAVKTLVHLRDLPQVGGVVFREAGERLRTKIASTQKEA